MCRKPIDWSKTSIYRLCCNDPAVSECYIGSTTNLTKRRQQHKGAANNPQDAGHNNPKYVFIRANGGIENWSVVLVEAYAATDSEDARRRERHWFEHYAAELNAIRPYVSAGEKQTAHAQHRVKFYAKNKDIIAQHHAAYCAANREKLNEYAAAYYANNQAAIAETKANYRAKNQAAIAQTKAEYYAKNKDTIAQNRAAYSAANREKLNEQARARYHAKKAAAAAAATTDPV